MNFLSYFNLGLSEFLLIIFTVFIASIIRGFNGFGFSATCISGFSFILPAIEIVPIILILEVFISIFMAPYIWNKIDWNFVFKLSEFLLIIFTVFIASIIRGFNGFGFSATCISGFSFILPAIEIVPIILILEVFISIFMAPYIWNKIDWNFVFKLLIGIIIGSPIGLYLLKYLSPQTTHLYVCVIIIFFSLLLMKGYSNQKINNNGSKIFTGIISGTLNGLTTLGGMPVALFLLITSIQPAVIRGSLAALFFLTDVYAFALSFFGGIVDMITIYRTLPLIIILPIGVYIGDKFFVKSKEALYRKVVFYFLIIISIFGILRITGSI